MKTTQQLNKEIEDLITLIKDVKNPPTKKQIKSYKAKIQVLRQYIRYL